MKQHFNLSHDDIHQFLAQQSEAMQICRVGVDEYICFRCTILNGLLWGYFIAGAAVEKVLKAFYRLKGGTKSFKKLGHNIVEISHEISKLGLDLSNYQTLFGKLEQHFKNRYPDNWPDQVCLTPHEINEIDFLFYSIFLKFPVPDEINYSTNYFGTIFNNLSTEIPGVAARYQWLTTENEALEPNLSEITDKCKELQQHLGSYMLWKTRRLAKLKSIP